MRLGRIESKTLKRWKACIGVYGLIGFWIVIWILFIIPAIRWLTQDIPTFGQVPLAEERYTVLREDLPSHSTVGYVSDISTNDNEAPSRLVQYTVAPVVIELGADCCELVIGDFLTTQTIHPQYGEPHLIPLIDYGNGVILYRNEDYAE